MGNSMARDFSPANDVGNPHWLKARSATSSTRGRCSICAIQEALAVYNDVIGLVQPLGAHRSVAAVMMQMGMVYIAQGMDEQAAKIYEELLWIQRGVLVDNHEDVATTLIALDSTMERQSHWSKAVEFSMALSRFDVPSLV